MLDSPTSGPTAPAEPVDDDARDRSAAAAPLGAVRAVVRQLDRACSAATTSTASWEALVVALRACADELARQDAAAWRLAVGSAVPLGHWVAGEWATRLRDALVDDGFTRRCAVQAVEVVAVHLQRTCPAAVVTPSSSGASSAPGVPGAVGPLSAYPVLQRLRSQLSPDTEGAPAASVQALLAQVAALRA